MSRTVVAILLTVATLSAPSMADERAAQDSLSAGFDSPPSSARPRVWWHWMNGNVTKDGIAKDLQWMKRVGIGGLQNFDANLITPQVVERRLAYMTPEWKDAFRFAAKTADELGLELAIAASPGWSETGGPWVKPENGMKKLVWTQTDVTGGRAAALRLPSPPAVAGLFHDLPVNTETEARFSGNKPFERPTLYADVAVFAYPLSSTNKLAKPSRMTSNGKALDIAPLIDDSLTTSVQIDRGTAEKPIDLVVEFDAPQTARSVTMFLPGAVSSLGGGLEAHLEVRGAGDEWREVATGEISEVPTTVGFNAVTARTFRVVLKPKAGSGIDLKPVPGADLSLLARTMAPKPTQTLAQLVFSGESRIHEFEAKAGFAVASNYYALEAKDVDGAGAVPLEQVVNLTSRMQKDGTLDWTPPKGHWRIVRLGYSLTGKTNHPATEEATGLEVDKYDARAVREYLEHYLRMYRETVGADLIGRRGLQAIITDSVEVGPSNWTPALLDHFKRLRGYDATPYLPALTGTVVGSRKQSDAFLYDYRRTLTELFASEHYGTVAAVAHEQGLKVYGEALEGNRVALGDDIQMRKFADYPMAALWAFRKDASPKASYLADMKTASSTAHLYGKKAVAAESMTSVLAPWAHAPNDLRRIIDAEFAQGISLPVIHTSAHQPVDDKQPGMSLMIFGQYFTRHETWAELAKPWIDYLSRNSFLLQQGRNFADVAYFYGEDASPTSLYADVPKKYAYDFVNADVVLNLLSVDGGDLVTPSGARYRVLYLGGSSAKMTLPVLRRLAELADAGATIVGKAPTNSPSLESAKREYAALVKRLWAGKPATAVGKGRVIASGDVEVTLTSMGTTPDFAYASADAEVLFVHRKLHDGDIYFVNNRKSEPSKIEARFRVAGRAPEIWRADTGNKRAVSYRTEGPVTVVPLEFDAEDSYFVVFRAPATASSADIKEPVLSPAMTLDGEWDVEFQEGRGAPSEVKLPSLVSLSQHAEPGVKYFSGVATYKKRFKLEKAVPADRPLLLDLGSVGDVAEVIVNGESAGIVWHAPYRIDISKLARKGRNKLEVRVANLWVNRLVGDAQPDAKKVTYTTLPTYRPDAPLRPSGLIGPVQLLAR
jgi:hypothetical protein